MTDAERLLAFERDPAVAEFFFLITEKAKDAAFAAGVRWVKEHPNADVMEYAIEGRLAEEEAAYDSVLSDATGGSKKSQSEAIRVISARLHTQIKAMSAQELSSHLSGTSARVPYTTLETELQEQPLLPQFSPGDIAETLADVNSAKFGPLVTGIDRAQKVLPGSYLFVLWTTRLTYAACCAQIVRMTPFLTSQAAQEFATASLNEWIAAGAQTEPTQPGYRPQISVRRVRIIDYASVQYESQSLRDSKQVTAIVLGPFPTAIVGFELIDAFSAPLESEALLQFFLAVNDDSYSRIETTICYAQDHPRRNFWGQGVYWHDDHVGDTVPETRFTGGDDAAGLTPPSVPVPMRIVRRGESASEKEQFQWSESRLARLHGNGPIRWVDVEPSPATKESTSPGAIDERDHGF
jgi:hypothetical protein